MKFLKSWKSLMLLFFLLLAGVWGVLALNKPAAEFKKCVQYVQIDSLSLAFYHQDNKRDLPVLILLHGAPGSASAFEWYVLDSALNANFDVYVPDRLGYGRSVPGQYHGIAAQANFYTKWIEHSFAGRTVYVFGHSYGATIASAMGIQSSAEVDKLLLYAPALDPENEKYFPLGRLSIYKWSRWMFSSSLRVSGMEKYRHAPELAQLEKTWHQFNVPALYVHGTKDRIVPYLNLQYSKQHFPQKFMHFLSLQDKGHLGVFTEKENSRDLMINWFLNSHTAPYE